MYRRSSGVGDGGKGGLVQRVEPGLQGSQQPRSGLIRF